LGKGKFYFLFKGRLKFYKVDGTEEDSANAPSCLVSYNWINTRFIEEAIKEGKIKGKLVILK